MKKGRNRNQNSETFQIQTQTRSRVQDEYQELAPGFKTTPDPIAGNSVMI